MTVEHREQKPEKSVSSADTSSPSGLPTEAQATALIDNYLTDTRRHCLQVGEVMRYFAKKL